MAKFFTTLVLVLSVFSFKAYPRAIIRSSDPWEPQVIYMKENPRNPHLIIFYLCHSKRKKKCFPLSTKEGVKKDVLLIAAKSAREKLKYIGIKAPMIGLIISASSFFLAGKFLRGVGGYTLGSGAVISLDALDDVEFSRDFWDATSMLLDPQQNFEVLLDASKMSIVAFAKALEAHLRRISLPCFNNKDQKSEKCLQHKRESVERAKKIYRTYPVLSPH